MSRAGAVTFKGNPMTLAGNAVEVGKGAPAFRLHKFEGGLKEITLDTIKGKATVVSVVPSLDTPVCQVQTRTFNQRLAALGDRINALTVSLDLPFAMNRFCGAEDIKAMRSGSDYMDRSFGTHWGVLIDELKILARAVFVLHDVEGYTHEEIAQELGITSGGSKSQLFKARAKLRRLLAPLVDVPYSAKEPEDDVASLS